MRLRRNFLMVPALLVGVLLLTACPDRTSISRINSDPGRYANKDVAIAGRVTDSYGILGRGAYEIDDGSGRMWVITQRGVPSKGSEVGSKGRVNNGFNFGGKNFGTVLIEDDRRSR